MEQKTHLGHGIEKTEYKSKYDASAKDLVSDRQVLARIVKGVTSEFKDYDVSVIEKCIEAEPEISVVSVYPGKGKQDKISGMNTENAVLNEGEITFDIRFYVVTPDEGERIKIILNVEVQKKYHVGYSLVLRGIFYCARMLSEQLDTEFSANDYDGLKKVYSIWICMDSPEKVANTITEYSMARKNLYGEFSEEERYDLLSVIMVRLSGKGDDEKGNQLLRMLTTLLSDQMDAETKKKKLEEEHSMRITKKLEGGINTMCNLSDLIEERGIAIGEERGINRGIGIGEEQEKCNTVINLLEAMQPTEIVKILKYEESFVADIVKLVQTYPDATNQEIFSMLKES